ncbi:MAG: SAM-dependent DNA methyltransferase [Prevotella sp.]|nr:SAM-dependent DNA methyltransferase [Prevotella sp.]
MTNVFRFLKRISTDISYINSLFVSAFVKLNGLDFGDTNYLSYYKDIDNKVLDSFLNEVSGRIDLEQLVRLFEFVISPSDKIVNGAIYTPKDIRNAIVDHCLGHFNSEQLRHVRVCDIACGCGGFLMDVAEYIHVKTQKTFRDIFQDNIYGIDIQGYSVERTKILLSLLALSYGEDDDFKFNLMQADTLDFCSDNWNQEFSSFDVIVGNPPYVCSRNVSKETKQKMLKYEVSQSGHPDLYIPFFQIAYDMLADRGKLGYITMNSFIRSVNGRCLRQYFSSNRINISIVDFRGHQVFKKKSTYTCLFFLDKGNHAEGIQYVANENGSLEQPFVFSLIPYTSLDARKGWSLNDKSEAERIEIVGIPIGKYCSYRHGIATLCNKAYIFKPVLEDSNYYYLVNEGIEYPIERQICRDVVNSNKLNSKIDFDSIVEKVIYPYYRCQDGKLCVIEEERMLKDFPYAYKYLLSQKEALNKRDKGNTLGYPMWYAYGRTQSLQMPRYKLFFPKFANNSIRCVLRDAPELLLYNGIAFVNDSKEKLLIIQKVIESNVFWKYITKNGKPYSSGYYSLSGVDIKNFGVPNFTEEEKMHLFSLRTREEIDDWLIRFYK